MDAFGNTTDADLNAESLRDRSLTEVAVTQNVIETSEKEKAALRNKGAARFLDEIAYSAAAERKSLERFLRF